MLPRLQESLARVGQLPRRPQLLALQVPGPGQLRLHVGIAGNLPQQGDGFVSLAPVQRSHGGPVDGLLRHVRRILIIAQGREGRPGLGIIALLQQRGGGQIIAPGDLRGAVHVVLQGGVQAPGLVHAALLQQDARPQELRLTGLLCRVHIIPQALQGGLGLGQQGFIAGIQLIHRVQVGAAEDVLLRAEIAGHVAEGGNGLLIAAGLHQLHGGAVAQVGQQVEHHAVSRSQAHRRRAGQGDPTPAAAHFFLIFLFPQGLMAGGVLPGGLGLQIQLTLPLAGLLLHSLLVQVGKDLRAVAVAADTHAAAVGVGPAADAQPQPLLLLGITHRVLPGNVAQVLQGAAVGQGVGSVFAQGQLAAPPYAVVVEPDLLHQHLGGCGRGGFLLHRHQHGERLLRQAMQIMGAVNHPGDFLPGRVQQRQRHLHGDNQLVGQVVQRQLAGGPLRSGQRRPPDLRRARQVDFHRNTSLRKSTRGALPLDPARGLHSPLDSQGFHPFLRD